jgi:hypothetical protein
MSTNSPQIAGNFAQGLPELAPGATLYDGPDDGSCRVIKEDGSRCRATRVKATGRCPGHSGIGGVSRDPKAASQLAHAEKRKRSAARMQLGISARRASTPLQAARVAAQMRADDYARAIVDEPLDRITEPISKQRAAIAALELLYPQATLRLEVDAPQDEQGVEALGWAEMQQLAASLLDSA